MSQMTYCFTCRGCNKKKKMDNPIFIKRKAVYCSIGCQLSSVTALKDELLEALEESFVWISTFRSKLQCDGCRNPSHSGKIAAVSKVDRKDSRAFISKARAVVAKAKGEL
jgi:hypothetical protein